MKRVFANKDFESLFNNLSIRHSRFAVWNDFVHMCAISIANGCNYREDRENQYMDIVKKYSKMELELVAQMFALMVSELDANRHQDFLGQQYMAFNFGDVKKGQYFTPYNIAELMAELNQISKSDEPYVTANDPCSGSGVMLIAAINEMIRAKKNPHTDIFVVAQDLDPCIAMMCYIQLSLLGAAGYVVIGDSIAEPPTGDILVPPGNAWCTPMFYHPTWKLRRLMKGIQ